MPTSDQKSIVIPVEPVKYLFDNGQFRAAKELGILALQSQPTNVELANMVAGSYYHLHEYKQAALFVENIRDKLGFFPPELQKNYALVLYYLRRIPEALEIAENLWKDIEDPVAETDLGLTLVVLLDHAGRMDEAHELLKTLDQDSNITLFNLGWHTLRCGEFLKGFEYLAHGNKERAWGSEHLFDLPRYKRMKTTTVIKGKTIFFACEGGQGDEIIFVRFAQMLKERGAIVNVGCSPHLVSVFSRLPFVDRVGTIEEVKKWDYDYYLPSMNSVNLLKLNDPIVSNMTYIEPLPEKILEKRRNIDEPILKIGIRWSGNPMFEHEQFRTIPARKLLKFATLGKLYSLQRDGDFDDLRIGDPLVDLRDDLQTWEDTLGYMANMDYIVTSCTSITHAAAAMGKKVCLIAPFVPYFPWAELKDTTIWYPTIRIFRQTSFDNWDEAIQNCYNWIEQDIKNGKT